MNKPIKKDTTKTKEPEYNWTKARLVRSPYEAYDDPGVDCSDDPGLTDGSQADELDVNNIIRRAQKSGILPGVDVERVYADVSEAVDYHTALNIVQRAQEQFMGLEATLRARFDNDPAKFMEFMHDAKNLDEMVKLGLVIRHEEPALAPTPQPAAPEPVTGEPEAKAKG